MTESTRQERLDVIKHRLAIDAKATLKFLVAHLESGTESSLLVFDMMLEEVEKFYAQQDRAAPHARLIKSVKMPETNNTQRKK